MKSLAIPSTCISEATCTSLQQATFALYQICRAALLYGVDEIVVFEVPEKSDQPEKKKILFSEDESAPANRKVSWETRMAANLLQFFLTPKHLHKLVFHDLKPYSFARKLPRVTKQTSLVPGIAIKKHIEKKKSKKTKKEKADARVTPYINFGFDQAFVVDEQVPLHSRVAIDLKTKSIHKDVKLGYAVRAVDLFSKVFTECTIPDGYTHTYYVGCQEFYKKSEARDLPPAVQGPADNDARVLLIISDWQSLETSVQADSELQAEPAQLFDGVVEGLNSARLEDATMVALSTVFTLQKKEDN